MIEQRDDAASSTPDLVVIGHVTRDIAPGSDRLGGAAAYASVVAERLGIRTALVTSAAPDYDLQSCLAGVEIHLIPSERTTVMNHVYEGGRRIQHLQQRAEQIHSSAIPSELSTTSMLLLGPVAGEVDPDVVNAFPRALIAADAQGWLRRFGSAGIMEDGNLEDLAVAVLRPRVSILVLSEDDLAGCPLPAAWTNAFPIVILSRGRDGFRLFHEGRWWTIPAIPAKELDATGAGDTLSAAFLVRYAETGHIPEAARFAAAAASFVIEAPGLNGAPHREAVEQRLRQHPEIRLRLDR